MSEFYSIITSVGLAKLAALPAGESMTLTHMAFGNSTLAPSVDQTELHSEQYRCELTKVAVVENDPECLAAEAIITADIGGFWIREIGIIDSDGDLIAVGKYPSTYKPTATDGSVKELGVRMILRVTNATNVIVTYNNGIMDGAANTDLSNLTYEGQNKLDNKANIDLSNLSATGQQKFDAKADLESPSFTGTPTAPTPVAGTNTGQLATTAYVVQAVATAISDALTALVNSAPEALDTLNELAEALGNDPSFAATVANQIGLKADIASPAFTGIPTAPTAAYGTNTTQIATTEYVCTVVTTAILDNITSLIDSAPEELDSLGKLATAINNDPDFVTTITNLINAKASKSGDTITVANTDPTTGFVARNIRAQTNDPGAETSLTNGQIILVYE